MEERGNVQVVATNEPVAEECLFCATRGAAVVARRGMVDGFNACLVPDWCETDDGDGDREDIEGEKGNEKLEL
jgi:hypothetical protein